MIKNFKMMRDVMKLERAAKKAGKQFEKENGRKPTQEEAESIARSLSKDFLQKYDLKE